MTDNIFASSSAELDWLREVREFVTIYQEKGLPAVWRSRLRDSNAGPFTSLEREYQADLGARGWSSLHWPRAFGGSGSSARFGAIMNYELEYNGLPQLEWTVSTLAPIIINHGTNENRRQWLDRIRSGDVVCALGYSEVEAGTDLANLRLPARLEGDEWIINGEKMWNSGAHFATHEWLAVRTDPHSTRHEGISILMVPMDTPGLEVHPMWTWAGARTNRVVFNDVRVPADHLIGEAGKGWSYISGALDYERAVIGARVAGKLRRMLDDLFAYCSDTIIDGQRLSGRQDIQRALVEFEVQVDMVMLMTNEVVDRVDKGEPPATVGTMQKVLSTELITQLTTFSLEIMDMYGQLNFADPLSPLEGEIEHQYRWAPVQRFAGGTNEVLRDIIAQRGLGLPRVKRRAS